jgi:hypothetical protein
MTFFQKPLDHFHDSLCPTLTGMKVDWEEPLRGRESGFGLRDSGKSPSIPLYERGRKIN